VELEDGDEGGSQWVMEVVDDGVWEKNGDSDGGGGMMVEEGMEGWKW